MYLSPLRIQAILLVLLLATGATVSAQTADLLVVNKVPNDSGRPGSVSFLDYRNGRVVDSLEVDREPHEIALTPDGRFALVANTGGYVNPNNTLSYIDVEERRVVQTVDLGALYTPHGLAYSTAHDLFYFTVEGSRAIGAYDPAAREVVWTYGTGQAGSHMLLISEDGKTIVTANRENASVSILKLQGDDPLAAAAWAGTIVPVGDRPEGLVFSRDADAVWVGLRSGEGLVLVDLNTEAVTETFPVDGHPLARLAWTPDGETLLAADPNEGTVLFIDPATGTIEDAVDVGPTAASLFLPPGGTHLLVGVSQANYLAEIDLATRRVTRRLASGPQPDAMAWPVKE